MAEAFYRRYLPDPRLADGYRLITDAAAVYRAAKMTWVAERLEAQLASLFTAIERQTGKDAAAGTEGIRRRLEARLVRDRTQGPHLAQHIVSTPLPEGLPGGAIGYGAIEQLDKAIDPDHPAAGTYWRAIEEGSAHMVGRIVVGYFQPGFAAPSFEQNRQHPMFKTADTGFLPGMVGAPAMRVMEPIQAKHFLRDGSRAAIYLHEREMRTLQAEAIDAMLATVSGTRTR